MMVLGRRKTEEAVIGNEDSGRENTGTSKDVLDKARVSMQMSSRKLARKWL